MYRFQSENELNCRMFKDLRTVLLLVMISLSIANLTDIKESAFLSSIEDRKENNRDFYQQKEESSNASYNVNENINLDFTVKKKTEDILIEILLKIHKESKRGELPESFIESLIAYFYDIDSEQATETDFFQLFKYLTNSLEEVHVIHHHDSYKVDLTYLDVRLSVLRNLTKYVSKDAIETDPVKVEKFLPLLRRYMIIENDTKLNIFRSNLFKVVKNTRNKNLSYWFIIDEKKFVKREVENSDRRIVEKSMSRQLSHVRDFFGTIFNTIKGGGESLLEWTLQLLKMVNLAFTERASILSIELFPITFNQIKGECDSIHDKVSD